MCNWPILIDSTSSIRVASIPVLTDKDGIQKLDLDLSDMSKFPYGLHRLNMRVASLGSQYSPVYSAIVMRLRGGANNYLTYWLDDDYANRRHTWSTNGNGKDAYFKVRLDFSSASAGMHRLHYRIASQDLDDGPIYEVPILVTRLYNNTLSDITITNQSTWLDDADAKQSRCLLPRKQFFHIDYPLRVYVSGGYFFSIPLQKGKERKSTMEHRHTQVSAFPNFQVPRPQPLTSGPC